MSVEIIALTSEKIVANIYLTETDITANEFVELINNKLKQTIENDYGTYFSAIDSVIADTTLAIADDDDDANNNENQSNKGFAWHLVFLGAIPVVLLFVMGYAAYLFCCGKAMKETVRTPVYVSQATVNDDNDASYKHEMIGIQFKDEMVLGTENASLGNKPSVSADELKQAGDQSVGLLNQIWVDENNSKSS